MVDGLIIKGRTFVSKLGLWWPIVLVPIWQEILFRYLPYKYVYLPYGNFWGIGLVTNIIFAAIHLNLGKLFVLWAFFWGIAAWFVMGKFGLLGAIALHALINIIDFKFGIRNFLRKFH